MQKNQGFTLFSMILTLFVILTLGIMVMRAVPIYIENYSVRESLASLKKLPASEFTIDATENEAVLINKLIDKFEVNGIDIPKEKIHITNLTPDTSRVNVKYQVTRGLIGNISLLFDFDESVEVTFDSN